MRYLRIMQDDFWRVATEDELKQAPAGTPYREYFDESAFKSGEGYVQAEAEGPQQPSVVVDVQRITGNEIVLENGLSNVTAYEDSPFVFEGDCPIPDSTFRVPVKAADTTGKIIKFPAVVKDGKFRVVVKIKESGRYILSDKELNLDLPPGTFHIEPITIDIMVDTRGL